MTARTCASIPAATRRAAPKLAGLLLSVAALAPGTGVHAATPPAGGPYAQDFSSPVLMRFQGTVDVPLRHAYDNLLVRAVACWSGAPDGAGSPAAVRGSIEDDGSAASIIVHVPSMGAGVALVSVRLHPAAAGTLVNAVAMGSTPGAPHLGSAEIHLLDRWAAGVHTACSTPRT